MKGGSDPPQAITLSSSGAVPLPRHLIFSSYLCFVQLRGKIGFRFFGWNGKEYEDLLRYDTNLLR